MNLELAAKIGMLEKPELSWSQLRRREFVGFWHIQPEIPVEIAGYLAEMTMNVQTGDIYLPGENFKANP